MMPTLIAQEKDEDATLGEEVKTAATLAPLPSSFVRASAAPQPKASYWALLKQEIRREERWSWLPTPPRRHLINFKGQDHDQPSRGFILFRVGTLLYWSCWLAMSVVSSGKGIHIPSPLAEYLGYGALWLIYATNWSATLLLVHLVLACLAMVVAMRTSDNGLDGHRQSKVASCLGVASWIIRDTVAPAAVMVTLLYWLLLFPIFRYTNFVDVHLHLINALIILADLWLSRLPYWLLHFPAPMAYLSIYILFGGIYYAAGGKAPKGKDAIYPWLDFERLSVTIPIIFLVLFVIFPLVHSSLWAFERKARQRMMARQADEARQRAEARQTEAKTEATTEEGVVETRKTGGRGRGREEFKQEKSEERNQGEHTVIFHSIDSSEYGEDRHELFEDAAATAVGTPRSRSWSGWTPWKKSPKKDSEGKQQAGQHRQYIRSVTPDELQHLREELLGEAVEEAEFEEAVDEAEFEKEQEWIAFEDAEQMSV